MPPLRPRPTSFRRLVLAAFVVLMMVTVDELVARIGRSDPAEGGTVSPDGFRGPPLRAHGPGTTRVVLFGESSTKALWERRRPFAPALRLLYSSRAYLLLRKQVFLQEASARRGTPAPPPGTHTRVADPDRREAWETMYTLCDTHDAVLVPVLPTYRQTQPPDRVIPAFAAAHGLPLVDLDAARRRSGIPEARFFADAVHPSAVGHQFIAEQLYAALITRGVAH